MDPDRVACYGCGDWYVPTVQASERHCAHTGDTGLSRWQIMRWLDACQAERDEWARRALQAPPVATVAPGPLAQAAADRWLEARRRNVLDNL